MHRYIVLFIFSISILDARINPFFPPKDGQSPSITTNTPEKHEILREATLALPSSARIIKEVSVEYINLDGSIERKSITLDNSIDWHSPIVISQANVSNTAVPNVKTISREMKNESSFKELASFKFISFFSKGKTLKIVTKDKYLQNFLIVNPYRIVIDFKSDYDFRSLTKILQNNIFKSIRVGNHDGFYRIVLELDGQYKYSFKQEGESYFIFLN